MFFKVVSFVLPALVCAQGSFATVIARAGGASIVPVAVDHIDATISTAFTKDAIAKVHPSALATFPVKTTSANTGFKSLAAAADPELVVCSSQNCFGTCVAFDLDTLPEDTCFISPIEFLSGAVISPTGAGLPIGVFVAQPGCADSVQIPVVNTCFNFFLNGAPAEFTNFFTLP